MFNCLASAHWLINCALAQVLVVSNMSEKLVKDNPSSSCVDLSFCWYILNFARFSEQNIGFAETSFQPLLWSSSGLMANQGAVTYIVTMGYVAHSLVEPGVLNKTLSHIWLNWNLPVFLFRVGLFTLMKIDSFINLVKSYPSLPMILKLSWVV